MIARGELRPLSVAPMMDHTDRHLRWVLRQLTRRTLLYTEMIVGQAIRHGDRARLLPDGTTSLTEKLNFECVFWSGAQGCTVYSARPKQCRTWPFWQRNVASGEHWRAAARGCPGIGQGPLFELTTIARTAADDGTSGDVPRVDEL